MNRSLVFIGSWALIFLPLHCSFLSGKKKRKKGETKRCSQKITTKSAASVVTDEGTLNRMRNEVPPTLSASTQDSLVLISPRSPMTLWSWFLLVLDSVWNWEQKENHGTETLRVGIDWNKIISERFTLSISLYPSLSLDLSGRLYQSLSLSLSLSRSLRKTLYHSLSQSLTLDPWVLTECPESLC